MKLYLHNLLQDNSESGANFPLTIVASEVQETPVEYNAEALEKVLKRVDMPALVGACKDLHVEFQPPERLEDLSEEQKRALHHVLFEIEVVSGELVSPSGRRFPIVGGIPDMLPESPTPADAVPGAPAC